MDNAQNILKDVFNYRDRGARQNREPILYTDFDVKRLRMFEVMPPTSLERWDELSAWSITERVMTNAEFEEVNACASRSESYGIGNEIWKHEGEPVRVKGYVKRPFGNRWTPSADIDEVKERVARRNA